MPIPLALIAAALTGIQAAPLDAAQMQHLLREALKGPVPCTAAAIEKRLKPTLEKLGPYFYWESPTRLGGEPGYLIGFSYGALDDAVSAVATLEPLRGHLLATVVDAGQVMGSGTGIFYDASAYVRGNRLVVCGPANDGSNTNWPKVAIYTRTAAGWHLRSEKIGEPETGTGGVHFGISHGRLTPNRVIVYMRESPMNIGQSHAGPQLTARAVWRVSGDRVTVGPAHTLPTALFALDQIAGAAQSGESADFNRLVPRKYRKVVRAVCSSSLSVTCAHDDEKDDAHDFYVLSTDDPHYGDGRGHFIFAKRHGAWRLVKFTDEKTD